ncbi:helix-turn-helix domain-containing protein [Streptomyces sp. NBC_01728]|uniref:helix-turn-helix domain-containing protein n=1 Tax=unclassified Streptomyces TaxID=2593676 RepID=UPI00224E19E4|nr:MULTISPECIES: helix-turn-helix domain-containing protein [unclassified Streptomyces]MCX4461800.1 helix-turn-helix domain-containing protein [Streptomyces sp. NBC_01719]MCX4490709.1 helix-turn-helix domain-containing protein [Streptomyces sp. NBC_01728]MCX4598544.1 helix-turn-helix domain-containing protein [Streptomyces sp. NBC_01549]
MPRNLTVGLTSRQQFEVRRRLAGRDLSRNERRRLECIRLLSQGLTAPQVAGLVECDPVTVRDAVHRFTGGGFDALADAVSNRSSSGRTAGSCSS